MPGAPFLTSNGNPMESRVIATIWGIINRSVLLIEENSSSINQNRAKMEKIPKSPMNPNPRTRTESRGTYPERRRARAGAIVPARHRGDDGRMRRRWTAGRDGGGRRRSGGGRRRSGAGEEPDQVSNAVIARGDLVPSRQPDRWVLHYAVNGRLVLSVPVMPRQHICGPALFKRMSTGLIPRLHTCRSFLKQLSPECRSFLKLCAKVVAF